MKRQTKFGNNMLDLAGSAVEVGAAAPDASLVNGKLEEVHLSDWNGKIKVIAVVPSMNTGVCQAQVREFNKQAVDFHDDVVVLAISMDLPFAQQEFCAANGLERVITLSDHRSAEFGTKYGFLMEAVRLLSRGVVIIDRDNIVRYAEYVPEVKDQVDFDRALAALREIE
ncbi:MAG: thiol peroxidase [Veillonellaceae bacterium]|nr:thiol peroxidase [Veillonellaceae bacterium]